MIRATVSAWPSTQQTQTSTYHRHHHHSPRLIIIITVMIIKPHNHDDQGNCVCLAIYTPNPRQPSNNSTASHQASLVRILKFCFCNNFSIFENLKAMLICFYANNLMISIDYRIIYTLCPCTQICFPELQLLERNVIQ